MTKHDNDDAIQTAAAAESALDALTPDQAQELLDQTTAEYDEIEARVNSRIRAWKAEKRAATEANAPDIARLGVLSRARIALARRAPQGPRISG